MLIILKKFLKKMFKVLLVILIILMAGVGFITYKCKYAKLPEGVIRVLNEEQYYKAIKKAISNYDEKLIVAIDNFNEDVYDLDPFYKAMDDTPSLNGVCMGVSSKGKKFSMPLQIELDFKYSQDTKILKEKEKAVQAKVKEIIGKVIKPEMKDYEKELALHDYLVENAKYDSKFANPSMLNSSIPKDYNTAYGILINKIGICGGYADAMDRLLKAAGIESTIVFGDASINGKDGAGGWFGHAWNVVKIGGEYYHLDPTWNDPIMEDGSDACLHDYFNLSDEQISKTHRWDINKYQKCTSTKYNFANLSSN